MCSDSEEEEEEEEGGGDEAGGELGGGGSRAEGSLGDSWAGTAVDTGTGEEGFFWSELLLGVVVADMMNDEWGIS